MPRKTKESEKEKETLKNRLFPKKTNKSIELEEPTEVSKKDNAKSTKSTSKKAVAQSKTTKKATKSVTKAKEAEKVTEKSKTTEKKKKATGFFRKAKIILIAIGFLVVLLFILGVAGNFMDILSMVVGFYTNLQPLSVAFLIGATLLTGLFIGLNWPKNKS